jgi:BirA family biotin operon repressor/biotin-[acetyl-CoA-carboxylase] ligase
MIGKPRVHHRLTDSTNERARELAVAGAPHGTLVTADEQSAGRGRQGRAWTAPPQSAVLMSVVLRELTETLPLAAAVAVCEALPLKAQIKWPNDVWIEGRKCAGVLIEARPQDGWAVIGIGLNVAIEPEEFPPELRSTATSLGGDATVESALAALNDSLARWAEADPAAVLASFRERDALRGREVNWSQGSGVADGIDERGNLIVSTDSGEVVSLGAGEVHLG